MFCYHRNHRPVTSKGEIGREISASSPSSKTACNVAVTSRSRVSGITRVCRSNTVHSGKNRAQPRCHRSGGIGDIAHGRRWQSFSGEPDSRRPCALLPGLCGDEIDDEYQCFPRQAVTAVFTVCQTRRDDELAPPSDPHARDTFLPAGDEAVKRKADRFAPTPRGIELFSRVEVDADVVNLDDGAWLCFRTISNDKVSDDEFGGGFASRKFNLWFLHDTIFAGWPRARC